MILLCFYHTILMTIYLQKDTLEHDQHFLRKSGFEISGKIVNKIEKKRKGDEENEIFRFFSG